MPLKIYSPPKSSIKKIIAVASGKGGVGKSFVAVSLARALKAEGFKVGLLDADLYGPSVKKMLTERRESYFEEGRIIPGQAEGLSFVSMGCFKKEGEDLSVRAPMALQFVDLFLNKTYWGELDFLVIDFPPGTGDIQIQLAQSAPLAGALLVTTPQEIALLDVKKAAALFETVKVPIIGIVENMSYLSLPDRPEKIYLYGSGGGKSLSSELKVPLLAEIPFEPDLGRLADLGFSFFSSEKASFKPIKEQFNRLVESVVSSCAPPFVHSIAPDGPDAFVVEWEEGVKSRFELYELQRRCPCASCKGEGQSEKSVRAKGVSKVGLYALKIDFASGCKNGIYSWDYLRELSLK